MSKQSMDPSAAAFERIHLADEIAGFLKTKGFSVRRSSASESSAPTIIVRGDRLGRPTEAQETEATVILREERGRNIIVVSPGYVTVPFSGGKPNWKFLVGAIKRARAEGVREAREREHERKNELRNLERAQERLAGMREALEYAELVRSAFRVQGWVERPSRFYTCATLDFDLLDIQVMVSGLNAVLGVLGAPQTLSPDLQPPLELPPEFARRRQLYNQMILRLPRSRGHSG